MDDQDKIIGSEDTMINIDYFGGAAAQPTLTFDYSDTITLDTSITSPLILILFEWM